MPRHHKVEDLLDERQLEDLRAFAREPAMTGRKLHERLLAEGYTLGLTAASNWLAKFREELLAERFSRSGELARAVKSAVEGGSFDDVADAAAMQLTQVVFEQASCLEAEGKIDPLDVQRMTRSLNNLIGGKLGLAKLLAAKFDKQAKELISAKRQITQEDLDNVRRKVFGEI